MANYFDRFDDAKSTNFFDRFDAAPQVAPAKAHAPAGPRPVAMMPTYDAAGNPTGMQEDVSAEAYTGTNPVDSLGRGLIQGATLGAGDEMWAAGAGAIGKMQGQEFGPAYRSALDSSQANNRAAREAYPWTYGGAEIAGAVPGLVYGGATAAGGRALGITGANLGTRSAAAAASGGVIGGVQGFAGTDGTLDDRFSGGQAGAAFGGALGAVSPSAAAVIGSGVGAANRWLTQRGMPIPGVPRSGMNMLAEDMRNSGGAGAVQSRLDDLGPEAMLLDASPSFQGRAQGLAVRPETREAIVNPLAARNAGTNGRLAQGIDDAFGPTPIPSQIEAGLANSRQSISPEYETALRGSSPVNTYGIANRLDAMAATERGPGQRAIQNVRDMLNETGGTGLDRSPRTLLNTRQAIDGMMASEADPNVVRLLTQAREMVDYELARTVPGIKNVDARFEELARQSAGLQRGSQVLDTGKTAIRPQEMQNELAQGAVPRAASPNAGPFSVGDSRFIGPSAESFRMRQGARGEIDRTIGVKANDLVALKQRFQGEGDWNRDKLAQLFGDDSANQAFRTVDREATFRDTFSRIDQNSMTAQRMTAADAVKPRGEGAVPSDLGPTLAGVVGGPKALALAAGIRGARYGVQQAQTAADISRNKALADVLMMPTSPQRDATVAQIADYLAKGERSAKVSDRARQLAQILLQSQGQRASDAAGARQLLLAR